MKLTAASAAVAVALFSDRASADLAECCGTGNSGSRSSGQGNDAIGVPLHRAGSRELVVGQTRQVPTTVVGSMAEIGKFLPTLGPIGRADLDTMKGRSRRSKAASLEQEQLPVERMSARMGLSSAVPCPVLLCCALFCPAMLC